ncbi:MAG: Calx-beta domain-containing protein [Planctomycetota bacterium]
MRPGTCREMQRTAAKCGGLASRGQRRRGGRLSLRRPAPPLAHEPCEPRCLLAADTRMAVGMNLENIVDWSPAWTFTDAFQASRPWIAHAVDLGSGGLTWDVGESRPLALDADGNVTSLATWSEGGRTYRQAAGTLMFRELGGAYAAGTYRAEWRGTGTVAFGFDARVTASGSTAAGIHWADLEVTPSDAGIALRIDATDPADPVRDIHVWMPDWQGRRFAGERWTPGAAFSPFHPLFLERLAPFDVIRFMGMQETNTSEVVTWADRRTAAAVRQGSGPQSSPSQPIVNGMSVEYMVRLANDLDADPWFNMPHMADDAFVERFATYIRDHLEPGRKAYVEWANEVWNFGAGFEAAQWVADRLALPENEGLDHWQVAGREAKRDLDIWSRVFAGQEARLVRVAAGWAAVDWVTNRIAESMAGSFDVLAIAPYITPTDAQRDSSSAGTTVEQVLADTRSNIATSVAWVTAHERLARDWSARLGRAIGLVAYEGGPHLDGRNAAYQPAFHAATNDPRMGDIYRDYLRALDAAGLDLYVDFQFTGAAGATPWGDFAKLHRMDQPLATAHRYRAVLAAADGSLWTAPPPPVDPPTLSIADASLVEGHAGRRWMTFTITLSHAWSQPVSVAWATGNGTAIAGRDYVRAFGRIGFLPGQTSRTIRVAVIGDRLREADETVRVGLGAPINGRLSPTAMLARGWILDDDRPAASATAALFAAAAMAFDDPPRRR